ncbi:MAG: putative hybrid sensor histidine [Planctomycetota bacterium]|nr:MAG: putative hybrid sensor histidine [Planctomycetota bacterium]
MLQSPPRFLTEAIPVATEIKSHSNRPGGFFDAAAVAQSHLRALYGVAHVIASTTTLDEAAIPALKSICSELGWDIGLLWVSSENYSEVRLRHWWAPDGSPHAEMARKCKELVFTQQDGVLGHAWSRRGPSWFEDAANEPVFLCRHLAAASGLTSMVVAPILFGGRLLGSLEMFTARRRPQEAGMLPLLMSLGTILGEFIDRVRSQDALEQRAAGLRRSERLEAIGRLAGGIAHDFNNMLTAILGFSDDLLRRVGPDSELRPDLEQIRRAGQRSADLTRQLLAFGRRQLLQPRIVDLGATLVSLEEMLRRLLGERIELLVRSAPGQWTIRVDPGQLEQVVLNLALNGRDAMPSGGRLTLEASNVDANEEFRKRHPGVQPGPHVLLTVSDTGSGMDEQTQARVFEPFFTTKAVGQGTGLGLSTTHGIVNQSGGHIWLASAPGSGTTFSVLFPRATEAARPAGRVPITSLEGKETLLVIEDEPAVLGMIKSVFESHGYSVLGAGNGEAAIAAAEANAGRIALVLSDVVIPGVNTRELAGKMRVLVPGAVYLYMSGYTSDVIVQDGVLDESVNFIGKPFSPDAILTRVRGLLDEKRAPPTRRT